MSVRLRLGPASISSSGRVGVSAGPISVYGGGRRGRGGSGGVWAPILGVLLLISLIVTYWYIAVPVALIAGVGAYFAYKARLAREAEAARAQAEALRQWLAAPAPPLVVPGRFTDRWFADNVPHLHPGQVPTLMDELRQRGWKDDRIAQRVDPYIAANPYIEAAREAQYGTR